MCSRILSAATGVAAETEVVTEEEATTLAQVVEETGADAETSTITAGALRAGVATVHTMSTLISLISFLTTLPTQISVLEDVAAAECIMCSLNLLTLALPATVAEAEAGGRRGLRTNLLAVDIDVGFITEELPGIPLPNLLALALELVAVVANEGVKGVLGVLLVVEVTARVTSLCWLSFV